MDSKTIAVIVVFAALTIALNLSPAKIPAPYAPFLIYQIWEIPIVAAFLLFGLRVGTAISIINTAVLLAVFPGELPTGPFYNLAAVLSMLFGIHIAHIIATRLGKKHEIVQSALFTTFGIVFRVGVMTAVNWTFLPFAPPVGFSMPVEVVVATLPIIGFFNATLALYTIPVGCLITKIVSSRMKTVGLISKT